MSLKKKEEIGMEVHQDSDQFFRIEKGQGKCFIDCNEYVISDGSAIVVSAGAKHNIVNTCSIPMKFYTIYTPPHHEDGVVHKTKTEAETDTEHFDDKTTEGAE